jgi:hypothetical protein
MKIETGIQPAAVSDPLQEVIEYIHRHYRQGAHSMGSFYGEHEFLHENCFNFLCFPYFKYLLYMRKGIEAFRFRDVMSIK